MLSNILLALLLITTNIISSYYLSKFLLCVLILITFLYFLFHNLRYNLVQLPFLMISYVQGKNFKMLTSLKDIKAALQLSDKGVGLEDLFSMPAWDPIISLESCSSPTWDIVRDNFAIFKPVLPDKKHLGEIASEEANKLLKDNTFIDSLQISYSTIKIFLLWIFLNESDEFKKEYINHENLLMLRNASLEYRKHIALKGKGNRQLKQLAVDTIVKILKKSTTYRNVLNWDDPVCYSVVMQPFVISPMINMSDIAGAMKRNIGQISEMKDFGKFIEVSLFKEHPFPVLERYDKETNTQLFINLLELRKECSFDGTLLNFGMGPRACLGRLFAKEFLIEFFMPLMCGKTQMKNSVNESNMSKQFCPELNHFYSGRQNDNIINFRETFYQMITFFGIIIHLAVKRVIGK